MSRKSFGLSIWTPLFFLFLIILASVWGKPWPLVNHHGLLKMYHQQVHGLGKEQKKEGECFFRELRDANRNRHDRSMNPFKAFLSWPGKSRKSDKVQKAELAVEKTYSHNPSYNQVKEPRFENFAKIKPYLTKEDEFLYEQKPGLLNDDDWDHLNNDQDQDQDMLDKSEASKYDLINSPMMDYKREFASDEANPYVESIRQRYEPSPHIYSD
ncbi:uncharacterized protein LOC128260771 isoform X1 [Drosophila gunungcola]|uniref:uncharacterized protein LOC128260771 isoform X1 n=1 Tax=Drosophila gunungcola TaxID=103775 RepID=UPI0022E83064|nr:uncharacterized protein LOC128260771 isoform X1 [Drosophila gunungcola]XP_052849966.1 uncharacterized protein LOC128260771 isoform X1 [Drosophila gunungcola]